jgi:hypothetical protein
MTWTVKTVKNNFMIAYEDLVLSTTPGTNDVSTSRFSDDMLIPGKDFIVGVYTNNTSSSGTIDVDVDGSYAPAGTYGVLKADLMTNKLLGGEFAMAKFAVLSNGEMPYMKVRLDPDDAGKATQVFRVYVIQNNQITAS